MSKPANAMRFVIAILLAALVGGPAVAQQNPFVGTWGESGRTLNGKGIYAAYWDFYPNGTMHSSRGASGAGPITHLCGAYRFNQSALEIEWNSYTPKLCAPGGLCEPPQVKLNQPQTLQYQIANPNELLLSDGDHFTRQPGNPWPLPPNGCAG